MRGDGSYRVYEHEHVNANVQYAEGGGKAGKSDVLKFSEKDGMLICK